MAVPVNASVSGAVANSDDPKIAAMTIVFFQAEDGIRDLIVTGVQTCALPICHTVVLSGVAGNCTVSGGTSRTVNVPSGGTATTSFTVSCAATSGTLTVSNSTTGSNLDPDGYTVTASGSAGTTSQTMATNGNVTFANIPAGSYRLTLSGAAANC